jgi:hypothetical protein
MLITNIELPPRTGALRWWAKGRYRMKKRLGPIFSEKAGDGLIRRASPQGEERALLAFRRCVLE